MKTEPPSPVPQMDREKDRDKGKDKTTALKTSSSTAISSTNESKKDRPKEQTLVVRVLYYIKCTRVLCNLLAEKLAENFERTPRYSGAVAGKEKSIGGTGQTGERERERRETVGDKGLYTGE
jgi:hypothetical protein